jgi:hypothetical protein
MLLGRPFIATFGSAFRLRAMPSMTRALSTVYSEETDAQIHCQSVLLP